MKKLIIVTVKGKNFPLLSMEIIENENDFEYFVSTPELEGIEFKWDSLSTKTATILQNILNQAQEEQEYLLRLIED